MSRSLHNETYETNFTLDFFLHKKNLFLLKNDKHLF